MKQKDILIIIILFFIFILVWIGGNIYHSGVASTISENTSQDIAPIAPTFDTKTIEKLKSREKIVPNFELGDAAPPSPNSSQGGQLLP